LVLCFLRSNGIFKQENQQAPDVVPNQALGSYT
jgi:hypothetical protein